MVAYLQKSKGSERFHQIIDFLTTSHISTLENGDMEITATIDRKVKVVSEASIRRHLKLEDSDGISTLPTSEIFEQLALMGNMKRASKGYTGVDTPLFQTMLVQGQILQEEAATMPHDSPLIGGYTPGRDEGSMTLNELTLIMKVKKLEHKVKTSKARRRVGLVVLEDEDELEDPSKQGRKIAQIDEDKGITLVQMKDYTAKPDISTANVPVSTAGAEVSTARPEVKTAAESLVYIRRCATKRKDKGKAIMKEDNIQAQIKADEELAHRLQAQERERYSKADKARLLAELINERKIKFAQQRRNEPMTQAQQKTYMCNYIKNMGSHTLQQLKKLSFDEIKELFETTMKRVVGSLCLMDLNL
ncbi:hypothetical protein Tco_1148033 [Tanacetum coccineum]